MIWAAIAFWRTSRHNPRLVYFFSMGAPPFLGYFFVHLPFAGPAQLDCSVRSAIVLLMVGYWDTRWRWSAACKNRVDRRFGNRIAAVIIDMTRRCWEN